MAYDKSKETVVRRVKSIPLNKADTARIDVEVVRNTADGRFRIRVRKRGTTASGDAFDAEPGAIYPKYAERLAEAILDAVDYVDGNLRSAS